MSAQDECNRLVRVIGRCLFFWLETELWLIDEHAARANGWLAPLLHNMVRAFLWTDETFSWAVPLS